MKTSSQAPLLKVGIMTDTHINEKPQSCRRLRAALKLFAAEKVDMTINLGDISNKHNINAYKLYRKIVNEIFPAEKPEEIFISAYHDWTKPAEAESSFVSMKEALQVPHGMLDKKVLNGFTFLVIPQNITMEKLEEVISEAVSADPGKPVFVIDHIPPYGLFHNGKLWGDAARLEVMKKFPSAIHISGHIHASLFDESNIWQGEFTAVNAGCLATWGGDFAAAMPQSKKAYEVIIMECFADKIVFRRISVTNGKEYAPESPWTIPLPFDPATAPYNAEKRKATSATPAFSPRAKIKLSTAGKKFEYLDLQFPEAAPEVFKYRITFSRKNPDGTFSEHAVTETPGNFYKSASFRKSPVKLRLPAALFEKGKNYRITILPVNFYDKEGTPLCTGWRSPAPAAGTLLFESCAPMKELPFLAELEGATPIRESDGFYTPDLYSARLVFPEEIWKDLPPETKLRLTADVHTVQENEELLSVLMAVANPVPFIHASSRIFTPYGDVRSRYTTEFPMKEGAHYTLYLRSCKNVKVRFDYVKIEIISFPEGAN